jgi:hypothetical protein
MIHRASAQRQKYGFRFFIPELSVAENYGNAKPTVDKSRGDLIPTQNATNYLQQLIK